MAHMRAGPIARPSASSASAAVDFQHCSTGLPEAMEDVHFMRDFTSLVMEF